MGMNISGFVTNQNLSKKIELIEKSVSERFKLEYETDVTFEKAASLSSKEKNIDFYFTDLGTLALCDGVINTAHKFREITDENIELYKFELYEFSMKFKFTKYHNKAKEWSILYVFEEELKIFGENYLNITQNDDVIFGTFSKLVEGLIGISFEKIDFNENWKRYRWYYS